MRPRPVEEKNRTEARKNLGITKMNYEKDNNRHESQIINIYFELFFDFNQYYQKKNNKSKNGYSIEKIIINAR